MTEQKFDRDVDLLVAGAGPGGMTAALVAALEGLDVLVCEKSEQVGGTAATSAGTLWIPGNSQSRAAGFSDSATQAEAYLDALTSDPATRDLRSAYLATGPDAIDYLAARTEVKFLPCGRHPDYQSNRPGAAVSGRAIVAAMFDGRRLKDEFPRVRPPIPEFMVFGGMMVGKDDIPRLLRRFRSFPDFTYSAKLFLRYLRDRFRHRRGTRLLMGNALVARLFYSLRQAAVPVMFGAALRDLIHGPEGIAGAVISIGGTTMRVRARRGVVLATGGFARNDEYRKEFMPMPTPLHSLAAAADEGDGLAAGQRAGARIGSEGQGSGAFWAPVSVTTRRDGSKGLFPHLSLDRAKPGLIAVNAAGRRFVNEGVSYHDFVLAMYEAHRTVPSIPAYLICETRFVRRYGLGAIHPGTTNLSAAEANGMITVAPTLAALAGRMDIDPVGLADSVARHNRFAESGSDLDFGKGDTELNRFNGDPAHHPNPCLAPIAIGPFCAMAVWPAELGCSAGLATDADARVMDLHGRPIAGLYACGNDMASIMAGTYPGPGTTLGPAIVFGYRAARHAAGVVPDAVATAAD